MQVANIIVWKTRTEEFEMELNIPDSVILPVSRTRKNAELSLAFIQIKAKFYI